MSKSNDFENLLLRHVFNNEDIPNIGDAAGLQGAAAVGSLYLSLHTADPGEAGDQTTNEISYTGYARVAVPRTAARLQVTGNKVELVEDEDFPKMTGGAGGTVTHFGIGTAASGGGTLLYSGETDPDILIQNGIIPRLEGLATGTATSVTED